jgi:uncharacterized protein
MIRPLTALSLFVTERCNLRCDYCFLDHGSDRQISWQTAQRAVEFLIEQSGDQKHLRLSFWGGEPLLAGQLLRQVADYATTRAENTGKRIHYSIPTNCTTLSEDALALIRAHDMRISLSIDGTSTSQSLRKTINGDSSYFTVLVNLERIQKSGMNHLVRVRKTITPKTVANLHRDVMFFVDHGLRQITFSPAMEIEWSQGHLEAFEEQQLLIADRWIRSLTADEPFTIELWDQMLVGRVLGKPAPLFCGAGISMLAADTEGRLFPCHRFVFYDSLNHVHRLGDVYSGIDENSLYRLYNAIDQESLNRRTAECPTCQYVQSCRLFCPAINYRLTGDALKNDARLCRFEMICERVVDHILSNLQVEAKLKRYLRQRQAAEHPYRMGQQRIDTLTDTAQRSLAQIRRKTAD